MGANNIAPIWIIFIPVLLRALTPAIMKIAAGRIQPFTLTEGLTEPLVYLASLLFFGRAISWQLVLRKFPLSFAYPFNSLSIAFILSISFFLLDESISWHQILGASLMMAGLIAFARGKE